MGKWVRAEVSHGPRGPFCRIADKPRVVNHSTWDSANVKKRLGWQGGDPNWCSQTSRCLGYSVKQVQVGRSPTEVHTGLSRTVTNIPRAPSGTPPKASGLQRGRR